MGLLSGCVACSEDMDIPESRDQRWMWDKPCVSSILFGPERGESCQQAVACGEELGFTDIIETPLSGQVLSSVHRPFPSTLPSKATDTSFMDGKALISPGSHFSFGAKGIFLWRSS